MRDVGRMARAAGISMWDNRTCKRVFHGKGGLVVAFFCVLFLGCHWLISLVVLPRAHATSLCTHLFGPLSPLFSHAGGWDAAGFTSWSRTVGIIVTEATFAFYLLVRLQPPDHAAVLWLSATARRQ